MAAEVTLAAWIVDHGPVQESAGLLMALDICGQASRLPDRQLAAVAHSLTLAYVVRGEHGGWRWAPLDNTSVGALFAEDEIVERIGTMLFHALTGQALSYPLAAEHVLRAELRRLRPGLPGPVANLTVDALVARRSQLSLSAFARAIRQTLGVERRRSRRAWRRSGAVMAALGAAAALIAVAAGQVPAGQAAVDGVLREDETVSLAIAREAAESFAFMDEHTAAIQLYQAIGRIWGAHVPRQDPRAMWVDVHHAWVRTLRADRLTTEQILENMPALFDASLGKAHPYTRTVRLALAATVEARGAGADAATLRHDADVGVRELLGRFHIPVSEIDLAPTPPGVVAHVAPHSPEVEGFTPTGDGAFMAPLTSTQQMIASRDGWRLHLAATGSCRVSLVTGRTPHSLTVNVIRDAGQAPQVHIEGSAPATTLQGSVRPATSVLLVSRGGQLEARVDGSSTQLTPDPSAPPPTPPYGVRFENIGSPDACALVWLEIPYPETLTFARR